VTGVQTCALPIFQVIEFTLIMDNSSLELFVKGLDKTITTRVYFNSLLLPFIYEGAMLQLSYMDLSQND